MNIQAAIQVHHWPNTTAVVQRISTATMTDQYWLTYATSCVKNGLDYFEDKFFASADFLSTASEYIKDPISE